MLLDLKNDAHLGYQTLNPHEILLGRILIRTNINDVAFYEMCNFYRPKFLIHGKKSIALIQKN